MSPRGLRKLPTRKKPGRRFPDREDSAHLERVRGMPCLLRGRRCRITKWCGVYPNATLEERQYAHVCSGAVQSHHVTTKARGGHDRDTVPLCANAHHDLHRMGQKTFEVQWGVDLAAEAARLAPPKPNT